MALAPKMRLWENRRLTTWPSRHHREGMRSVRSPPLDTRRASLVFQNALETLKSARSKVTALHFVHEQQQFLFIAELSEPQQIFRCGRSDTPFALNSFDHDRHSGRLNCRPHRVQVVIRHMSESRHDWLKPFLNLFLSRRRDSSQRPAMKGVDGGNDFVPTFIMAEFPGQFEKPSLASTPLLPKKHFPGPIRFTSA